MIPVIIIGVIAFEVYCAVREKQLPKEIFQYKKKKNEELTNLFYKSFIPMYYDAIALKDAYNKGLPRLSDVEVCKYFSYPKEYILDENENLIVNDVNLGDVKECKLMEVTFQGIKNYGTRLDFIKSDICKGSFIVNDYKFDNDFTALFSKKELENYEKKNVLNREIYKVIKKDLGFLETNIKNRDIKEYLEILPQSFKDLYKDFNENQYSNKEMYEKLKVLYLESNNNYTKTKNKLTMFEKEKDSQLKHKVSEFYVGYGEAENDNAKDNYHDFITHTLTGYQNEELLKTYKKHDEEIIKEYDLR